MNDYIRPAPRRRPLDLRAVGCVLVLCAVWGLQQVAMKSVAQHVAPIMQLTLRFAVASLVFGAWVLRREGRAAWRDGTLRSGVLLGVLFSLEFVFLGQSLLFTTAAHSVVFLYTAPIFTALGLKFIPDERLSGPQWAGIDLAFGGIVVAFSGFDRAAGAASLGGDLLALLGGASWGLSTIVLRRGRIGGAATAKTVFYQVATATLILGVFAAGTGQSRIELTRLTIAVLVFQTLGIAIWSYLLWFWLLRHYLTSPLMLLSLMTPLFGVLFGAALLGDPITPRFAAGGALVLAGILIVNLRRMLARRVGSFS